MPVPHFWFHRKVVPRGSSSSTKKSDPFLAVAFNMTLLMFESFDLVQRLQSNTDVRILGVQFTAFVWLLMGSTTYLTLLLRHKKLMAFFQDQIDFKNCLNPLNTLGFIRNNKETLKIVSKKYVAFKL